MELAFLLVLEPRESPDVNTTVYGNCRRLARLPVAVALCLLQWLAPLGLLGIHHGLAQAAATSDRQHSDGAAILPPTPIPAAEQVRIALRRLGETKSGAQWWDARNKALRALCDAVERLLIHPPPTAPLHEQKGFSDDARARAEQTNRQLEQDWRDGLWLARHALRQARRRYPRTFWAQRSGREGAAKQPRQLTQLIELIEDRVEPLFERVLQLHQTFEIDRYRSTRRRGPRAAKPQRTRPGLATQPFHEMMAEIQAESILAELDQ